jgi:hypothetical protein
MQTLLQTLQDQDLGHLKAVAELWGLELPAGDAAASAAKLASLMLQPDLAEEIVESLPPKAMEALQKIMLHGGRMPLADLTLEHGAVRRMGPAKRDREKPWRSPRSDVEVLWYRGLIATAFADTAAGPREFVFIPTDLGSLLPASKVDPQDYLGGPSALPSKTSHTDLTCVYDATTLLAALRGSPVKDPASLQSRLPHLKRHLFQPGQTGFLVTLLLDMGILDQAPIRPILEQTQAFLQINSETARRQLFQTWLASERWNDLAHLPSLRLAGERWPNDPVASRQSLLQFLQRLPIDTWWSVEKWVRAIRQWQPSFQRPGVDFDSWYLQSAAGGDILSGVAHWDQIDGALLRYWISGPLYWLGMTELGYLAGSEHPDAFRLLFSVEEMTSPLDLAPLEAPQQPAFSLNSQGVLRINQESSRVARYQIARIGEWLQLDSGDFVYRLSPRSLGTAGSQGVTHDHIVGLLEKFAKPPIPPSVLKALERWHNKGVEARLEETILLRLKSKELVNELMANKSTARYLKMRLGDTTFKLNQREASHHIGRRSTPVPAAISAVDTLLVALNRR